MYFTLLIGDPIKIVPQPILGPDPKFWKQFQVTYFSFPLHSPGLVQHNEFDTGDVVLLCDVL